MMNKVASLTPELLHVIRDKGTEPPYSHDYETVQKGTYLCRQCGLALFRGDNQFHSGCGWPSFDEEIPDAVKQVPDRDGRRTEILCRRCGAHLGHVFTGEQLTLKNTRHCVNGLSLDFVADQKVLDTEEAMFAAGCFWGVEALFKKLPGVVKTEVGYSGGHTDHPNYQDICRGDTGHYEVLRVIYDKKLLSFEQLCKYFFEIHDFSQNDGQGPDIGLQYQSRIFYYDEPQKEIALMLIKLLQTQGYSVATQILPVSTFWPAEDYHQDYYGKNGHRPYCHTHKNIFK